jgi:hypothetical protein
MLFVSGAADTALPAEAPGDTLLLLPLQLERQLVELRP